jgi:hypothetical protein
MVVTTQSGGRSPVVVMMPIMSLGRNIPEQNASSHERDKWAYHDKPSAVVGEKMLIPKTAAACQQQSPLPLKISPMITRTKSAAKYSSTQLFGVTL